MRCRRDHCYWPVSFSITVLQVGVAALKAGLFESAWICCRDADEFAAALLGSGKLIPCWRMQRTAARRAGRSLTAFGVVFPADRAWIDVELELELELPQALIVRAAAAAITASVLSFIPGPVRGRG